MPGYCRARSSHRRSQSVTGDGGGAGAGDGGGDGGGGGGGGSSLDLENAWRRADPGSQSDAAIVAPLVAALARGAAKGGSAGGASTLSEPLGRKRASGGVLSGSAAKLVEDLDVPEHLHVYAPAALAVVVDLEATRAQIEAELVRQASLAGRGGATGHWAEEALPVELPALRWDTSVLDVEEDRVIWVRESDLGKTALQEP